MLESRLIEHLKLLDAEETLDFLRYAKAMSEYEKGISEDTLILLKYVCKHLEEDKKLAKEAVYKNIYPKETWKNGKLDKLMTNAMTLLKSYISFTHYLGNEINDTLALSAFYRKKKQAKFFENNKRNLDKLNETIEKPQAEDFLNQYFNCREQFYFKTDNNDTRTRRENLHLPETIYALDVYYLIERLDFSLKALKQNQYIPFDANNAIENTLCNVIELAKQPFYQKNILIQLYLQAIDLQINPKIAIKDDILQTFTTLIEQNISILHFNDLILFCNIARAYCTEQYNKGRNEFLTLLFELHKKHLYMGVLHIDGKIRASTMQNALGIAVKLKKYDFVKQFLDNHKDKITGTSQPELIWQYNYALYHFEIGQYKIAYENLPNYLDLEDTYNILAARRLEIKILFHTEENSRYDTLGNKLDAFKNFLFESNKHKRISEHVFNMNNDFVDLLKQIRGTIKNDKSRVEKLKEKYYATPSIAEREWLLEKLEALG